MSNLFAAMPSSQKLWNKYNQVKDIPRRYAHRDAVSLKPCFGSSTLEAPRISRQRPLDCKSQNHSSTGQRFNGSKTFMTI
jgi:hypothetical protein